MTRILPEKQSVFDYLPQNTPEKIKSLYQEPVDFDKVRSRNKKDRNKSRRVSENIETNYDLSDGMMNRNNGKATWAINFRTKKAKSLSFHFDDLKLPESASMYIFSKEHRMVQGPILSGHVFEGDLASDMIKGNKATIVVYLDEEDLDKFYLRIVSINHGIPKVDNRAFGDAGACNFDVRCSVGNSWTLENDAVGLMTNGNGIECSGALINTECNDMTPYFLTAEHCLAGNLNLYTFRFGFEAETPSCPGTSTGDEVDEYVLFTGAQLVAFREDHSDFALLEFNNEILGTEGLTVAGWNRSTNAATSGVTIHHPDADAKKISTFSTTVSRDDNYQTGFELWVVDWDNGVTEFGSSGSPLFDQNKRIVGQLWGGNSFCGGQTLDDGYGRFDNSWTGGGTSATRLSDWLGDSNPATFVNSMRVPYIDNNDNEVVCSSNKSFTLVNAIPGRSTSWSVSPSSLVNVSSGSGTIATFQSSSSSSSGLATLTFTLSKSGCDPVTLSETIWIGKPSLDYATVNGQPAQGTNTYSNPPAILRAYAESASNVTSYSWEKVNGNGNIYPSYNSCNAYSYPFMTVRASASNTCGSNSLVLFSIYNTSSQMIVNNPTEDVFYLDVSELRKTEIEIKHISVLNEYGNQVVNRSVFRRGEDKISFNLANQIPGSYTVRIVTDSGVIAKNVIKI